MGNLDYPWVPLVPEFIGCNDQFILNVISMANALAFGFLAKNPFVFGNWTK